MTLPFCRALLASLSLTLAISMPAHAQKKIRIALWDVENNAAASWAFWNEMGPAARNHIDTAFSENPTLAAKFAIVERTSLDLILKEQGLATAGEALIDPVTGASLGAEEKQTGTATVSEVQDKYAIVTLTGTATAKDVLRKQ